MFDYLAFLSAKSDFKKTVSLKPTTIFFARTKLSFGSSPRSIYLINTSILDFCGKCEQQQLCTVVNNDGNYQSQQAEELHLEQVAPLS